MKKSHFIGFVSALALLTTGAAAADLTEPAGPPDWTGFYVGIHGGYGFGDTSLDQDPVGNGNGANRGWNIDPDPEGFFAGLQGGFDYQLSQIVIGAVADYDFFTDIDGSAGDNGSPPLKYRVEYDELATIRARAGFLLTDDLLLYGHGGIAFASLDYKETGGGPWKNRSSNEEGWIAGLGAEYRPANAISLFVEYSFADFGHGDFKQFGNKNDTDFDNELNIVKAGVNFRF